MTNTILKKGTVVMLLLISFSCSKTKTILLKTENAEGITNETKLKINGLEVGEIENIALDQNGNVVISANIKSDINLPIDSEFKTETEGLISGKTITITVGKSKETLTEKTQVVLRNDNTNFFTDSIKVKAEKLMDQMSHKDKIDSILEELKRLNENLERKNKLKN
jgi:ABC-type transporter Mla subunit MlaD